MRLNKYLIEAFKGSSYKNPKIDIDSEYYESVKKSPEFKKMLKMKKTDLINALGNKLWVQRNKKGRIMDIRKEIANRRYSNLEMTWLLYTSEYNKQEIPNK
jgi:hypothetical protein